jgi:hypothetical protein
MYEDRAFLAFPQEHGVMRITGTFPDVQTASE